MYSSEMMNAGVEKNIAENESSASSDSFQRGKWLS